MTQSEGSKQQSIAVACVEYKPQIIETAILFLIQKILFFIRFRVSSNAIYRKTRHTQIEEGESFRIENE